MRGLSLGQLSNKSLYNFAEVVELVYTLDLESSGESHVGSTPTFCIFDNV